MNSNSLPNFSSAESIHHIRQLLGKSRISSWWGKQSRTVREGICRAAALKPVMYWDKRLEDMTDDEREAIRQAVVNLKQAVLAITATDRGEWLHVPDFASTDRKQEKQQGEVSNKDPLLQQAQRMQQRADMLKAAQL